MKNLLISLCCFTAFFLHGVTLQAQQFNWVKGGGTTGGSSVYDANQAEVVRFMCTDANGNVYAVSRINNGTVYADTFSHITYGSNHNVLLTSYNCSGQMRWAKLIASSGGTCEAYGIATDKNGHIYVSGTFTNAILRIGTDTAITGIVNQTQALIQFDTTGHFNWIRYVGDNTPSTLSSAVGYGSSLAIDSFDNVHFFNYMRYGVHLTPSLTSHMGTYDLAYNSSGTLLNIKRFQLDSTLQINGFIIDKQSNKVYGHGYRVVSFWTDYGGDSSAYNFIAEFDSSRNRIWLDTIGNAPGFEAEGLFSGIVIDSNGHLYVSGGGIQYVTFQGNRIDTPHGAAGRYIAFIMKMDTAGNMKWLNQFNGHYNVGFPAITLRPGNKVATSGGFLGLANMGSDSVYSATRSLLITVLDSSGALITLLPIRADGSYTSGLCITSDQIGNLYIGGSVTDTLPDTLITAYHSVGGVTDFFVLKYGVDCSCTSMPVGAYTYSLTGLSTVNTTYTGTTAGLDSVVWHFGDGTAATGLTASHTYTVVGDVDLCVTVYTSCGRDIKCNTIRVNCPGTPASSFTSSGSLPVSFTYTGTTLALDSVVWSYGDGNRGTGLSPAHTYSVSGTYTVCATAYTRCGNNTACNPITVSCTPAAAFTWSGSLPVNFTYTGSTTGLTSVTWDFGDGATATGSTPSHIYSVSGTYTVCATVHTACGNDTTCNIITVSCTPVSSYTYSGIAPMSFTYMGSTLGLTSVTWDFGDGGTATGTSPSHSYAAVGTYTVCATVHTSCGNDDSCGVVNIPCIGAPVASFTDTGSHTFGFIYTGTTMAIDSIVWSFGDGSTATGPTALHTYAAAGTYHVCVTAYNPCGSDSICHEVVRPTVGIPTVSFANIKVFPNPAMDELMVTGVQSNMAYRLLSITGAVLQQGLLQTTTNTISIKDYAPGIYILEMTDTSGVKNMVRVVKE